MKSKSYFYMSTLVFENSAPILFTTITETLNLKTKLKMNKQKEIFNLEKKIFVCILMRTRPGSMQAGMPRTFFF